jgi:predicted Zn-dependent peptidase
MELNDIIKNNLNITTNNDNIFMIQVTINCGSIHVNAYTTKDVTSYYIKCSQEFMKDAIDHCIDIVFNTSFADVNLENEKKVVLEEMNLTRAKSEFFTSLLETILDDDNLYNNVIVGSKQDITSATKKVLQDYNDYFYHLSNTNIMCSCASSQKPTLKRMLKKALIKYKVPINPPISKKLYNTFKDECDFKRFDYSLVLHDCPPRKQNAIYFVFKIPSKHEIEHLYLQFIQFVLSKNNKYSLLFEHIRTKKGLVYNIISDIELFEHFGMYTIGLNTSSSNCVQIIEDIFKIMNDNLFTKNKMSKSKFEKFKKDFIQRLNFDLTNNDKAFDFQNTLSHLPKHHKCTLPSFINMIEKMTQDEFVEICNSTVNLNKMGCFIISPLTSEKELTTAFIKVLDKFKNVGQ